MEPQTLQKLMDINSTNESERIFSFFQSKRKLSSQFDHKGAKRFLNEKENALQKIILDDVINNSNDEKYIIIKTTKRKKHHHHSNKEKLKPEKIESFPTFGDNDGK